MKTFLIHLSLQQIISEIQGKLHLKNDAILTNVAELKEANNNSVCFFENYKFLDDLKSSKAGLIFVPQDFDINLKPETNLLLLEKPYISFMMLINFWLELCSSKKKREISNTAKISNSAQIGKNVAIGNNVVIEDFVKIGMNTIIEANTVIQKNVQIGSNCHIYPNVTIYEDCIIKDKVILHAGCIIGADGFGYIFYEGKHNKIPQVGNVILEDEVEIGANSAIDRATIGSTIVGKGTKIDNLVQVGHNCNIGENSILCAQVGLAGSTEIGNVVYLAGQVGVAGHLKIDDEAMVGAQSGVTKYIPKKAKYFGTPALEAIQQKKMFISLKKLPGIIKKMKRDNRNRRNGE